MSNNNRSNINVRSSNSNSKGIGLGFGIGIAVIVIIVIIVVYMMWPSTSSSSSRKYTELQSSNKSGKCDATKGTVSKDAKSSDDCASACDADSTPCNGYDWDGTTCTLYADAPTKVDTSSTKDKCYVPVLTK
jgi:hypothetical protein